MTDPMTEGAKTGTAFPKTDGLRRSLRNSTGQTVQYFEALKLSYELEHALTESLKVAGEALSDIRWHLYNPQDISWCRDVAEDALAALERIRNQALS